MRHLAPIVLSLLLPAVGPAQTLHINTGFSRSLSQPGVMFDVEAKTALRICHFWVNLRLDHTDPLRTYSVLVYTKSGTHVGFEENENAWTLLGRVQGLSPAGLSAPTLLPLPIDLGLARGERRALYLQNELGEIETLGTGAPGLAGLPAAEDNQVRIHQATALNECFQGVRFRFVPPQLVMQYSVGAISLCEIAQLPVERVPADLYDGPGGAGPLVGGKVYVPDARLGQAYVPVGKTLTVDAGAIIKFMDGFAGAAALQVSGNLIVNGGTFTSINDDELGGDSTGLRVPVPPQRGDWIGITARAGSSVTFRGGQIRYAGKSASFAPLRGQSGAQLDVDRLWIRDSAPGTGYALDLSTSTGARVTGSLITDNDSVAIGNVNLRDVINFADNVASDNLRGDYLELRGETVPGTNPITTPITLSRDNYPGDVVVGRGNFCVGNGGRLVLGDDVTVKFVPGTGGSIWGKDDGVLEVRGKPGSPVIVTSLFDDTIGGDTNRDGAATQPQPGDWGGVQMRPPHTPGVTHAEFCMFFLSYGGNGIGAGVEIAVANANIDALSICNAKGAGLRINNMESGVLTNVLVDDAEGDGIQLFAGGVDINHATVTGSGGEGITANPAFTGRVTNSISWANGGGNYGGSLDASRVLHSNGGFAGQNGNVDVDPLFALSGKRLLMQSPVIDIGDRALDPLRSVTDNRGVPRASGPTGQTDMGASEYIQALLVRNAKLQAGEALRLQLQTSQPGVVAHVFGFGGPPFPIPGLGTLLVGFPGPIFVTPGLPTPGAITIGVPALPSSYELAAQSVVVPVVGAAFMTNVIAGTVAGKQ